MTWELMNEVNHHGLVAVNIVTGETRYLTADAAVRLVLDEDRAGGSLDGDPQGAGVTKPPVDEATSPATADDLRLAADAVRELAAQSDDSTITFIGMQVGTRLDALADIRDSERATREAAVIDAMLAWWAANPGGDERRRWWREVENAIDDLSRLPTSPEPSYETEVFTAGDGMPAIRVRPSRSPEPGETT